MNSRKGASSGVPSFCGRATLPGSWQALWRVGLFFVLSIFGRLQKADLFLFASILRVVKDLLPFKGNWAPSLVGGLGGVPYFGTHPNDKQVRDSGSLPQELKKKVPNSKHMPHLGRVGFKSPSPSFEVLASRTLKDAVGEDLQQKVIALHLRQNMQRSVQLFRKLFHFPFTSMF